MQRKREKYYIAAIQLQSLNSIVFFKFKSALHFLHVKKIGF